MKTKKKRDKKHVPRPLLKPLGMRNAHKLEFPGYSASVALGMAHLEEQHIYDLLSNADLARRIAPNGHPVLPVAQAMVKAIAEIQQRAERTGKHGVTGPEMTLLREGVGKTMDYLRTVSNAEIHRASQAAVAEFNRTGALRV